MALSSAAVRRFQNKLKKLEWQQETCIRWCFMNHHLPANIKVIHELSPLCGWQCCYCVTCQLKLWTHSAHLVCIHPREWLSSVKWTSWWWNWSTFCNCQLGKWAWGMAYTTLEWQTVQLAASYTYSALQFSVQHNLMCLAIHCCCLWCSVLFCSGH
jgi:hypothetical protein